MMMTRLVVGGCLLLCAVGCNQLLVVDNERASEEDVLTHEIEVSLSLRRRQPTLLYQSET